MGFEAENYDIAIIGAGPAGATAARLLDSRFRVIVIDKKGAGGAFCKPCGGLLAMDAQKALSKFNLTLPKDVLVDPQIFAVKTIDPKQRLLRYYQRFYINLDRHKFDMWLMSLIPGRVEVAGNYVCTDIQRRGGAYEITFTDGGGATRKITAKYVIGADGSSSLTRQKLFPRRKIRRYLSIQQWFSERHTTPFYSCVFDSDITDSYCWSISKDGNFILGGAFPPETGRERFELLKQKLAARGFSFGEPLKTEACMVSMPRGIRDFCAGGDGAFLIGEAAGFISPSSLEGISYALDSAYALARILNSGCAKPEWEYRKKSLPMRVKLLMKYVKSLFMYTPFLRKLVMKSGIMSIDVDD
ncbi:MAG: FAD-binding protein [Oscillospiraceae bacterium]|jgi:flavin-dependent dehydrogenase|nr:FAD-binding protein [Oscillospiraceae bacterium]